MQLLHWMPVVVICSFMDLCLPGLVTSEPLRVPSQEPTAQVTPVNTVIAEPPNVIILENPQINLFNEIPSKDDLIEFGIHLLDVHYGTKMKRIEEEHKYSIYEMAREICRRWLGGSGKHPVTWNTLIDVLKQTQLLTLAGHIESSIDKEALNKAVNSFADSDIVLRTAMFLREVYSIQHITEFNDVGNVPFLDILAKGDISDPSGTHWKDFIYRETLPHRLLITGQPGTGKTTLL